MKHEEGKNMKHQEEKKDEILGREENGSIG